MEKEMDEISKIFTPEEIQRIIENEKLVKAVISGYYRPATEELCKKYHLFLIQKVLNKIGNDAHERIMKTKESSK